MKKAKFLLFSLLIFSFGIGQDSYEMSLGYNLPIDKVEAGYSGFQLLKKEVNGLTFNTSCNFRESKIFSTKLGLSYNFNAIKVDYYTKNDSYQNDGSYIEGWRTILLKEHRFQLYALSNLNYFDFNAKGFKVNPQIGIILNRYVKSKYSISETEYFYPLNKYEYYDYSKLNSKTVFDIDLIFGFQIEKQISTKSSILFDLNYIRKIDNDNRYFEFYETKKEFRFSAGIKKNVNNFVKESAEKSYYLSASLFNYHFNFQNDDYGYIYPSTSFYCSPKSKIRQNGFSIRLLKKIKRIQVSNEMSFSKISIDFFGSIGSHYMDIYHNTFDSYSDEFEYKSTKIEFENSLNVGYNLLKNSRLELIPELGVSFLRNSKSKILVDEWNNGINISGGYGVHLYDNSFFQFVPKFSFLINYNISNSFKFCFATSRNLFSKSHIRLDEIYDTHFYRISLGLAYKIK